MKKLTVYFEKWMNEILILYNLTILQSYIHSYSYYTVRLTDLLLMINAGQQVVARTVAGTELEISSSCLPVSPPQHYNSTILAWKYLSLIFYFKILFGPRRLGLLRRLILWGLMTEGWIVCLLGCFNLIFHRKRNSSPNLQYEKLSCVVEVDHWPMSAIRSN